MKTPTPIMSFFKINNIKYYKLIQFNEHKGRYCYYFKQGNASCFLKWNDREPEHKEYWESLQREIRIYRSLSDKGITPESFSCLINKEYSDDLSPSKDERDFRDMLIIGFLENPITLRTALIAKKKAEDCEGIKQLISAAFYTWQNSIYVLSDINTIGYDINNYSLFKRYLRSLLCSGPLGTKNNIVESCINRVFWKADSIIHKKQIMALDNADKHIIHGDSHLSNFLVSNNKCVMIDFENVQSGSAEIELAYMYSQIRLLLGDYIEILDWMDEFINNQLSVVDNLALFKFCSNLYYKSIRRNHRFY